MPTIVQERKRRKPLLIAAGIVGVLVILAGVGGYWLYQQYLDHQDQTQYVRLSDELQSWQRYRQYDEAIKEYSAYAKTARTVDHRAFAYVMVGGMYEQKRNFSPALDAYRAAEKTGTTNQGWVLGIDEGVARSADQLGDKATAIAYLQRAADLAEKQKDPFIRESAAAYRERIRELETK